MIVYDTHIYIETPADSRSSSHDKLSNSRWQESTSSFLQASLLPLLSLIALPNFQETISHLLCLECHYPSLQSCQLSPTVLSLNICWLLVSNIYLAYWPCIYNDFWYFDDLDFSNWEILNVGNQSPNNDCY